MTIFGFTMQNKFTPLSLSLSLRAHQHPTPPPPQHPKKRLNFMRLRSKAGTFQFEYRGNRKHFLENYAQKATVLHQAKLN